MSDDLIDNLLHRLTATAEEAGLQRQRADHLQALVDAANDPEGEHRMVEMERVDALADHYCNVISRLEKERDEAVAQQQVLRESRDAHKQDVAALRKRVGVIVDEFLASNHGGKIPIIKLYKMRDLSVGLYDAKLKAEASPWWARVEKLRALEREAELRSVSDEAPFTDAREDVEFTVEGPTTTEPLWYPVGDWTEHDGSGVPEVLHPGDLIEVMFRAERVDKFWDSSPDPVAAWQFEWDGSFPDNDIVAWRRVED